MTRWDIIEYIGKEECAKAISFCVVKALLGHQEISCEELVGMVKSIQPDMIAWLSEEVDFDIAKEVTATENASALEKAYRKGYYDALQRQVESE